MRNAWAVATRELRSYFLSPLAYVVIALFLVLSGYLFALILANGREASLRGLVQKFDYLQMGLAVVLGFVGVKMLLTDVYEIPIWISLLFIAAALSVSILASLRKTAREAAD